MYTSTVALPSFLTGDHIEFIVEKIRERAFPEVTERNELGIPTEITVTWEFEDGWDLYEAVHEIQNEVDAYIGPGVNVDRPSKGA